jgi:2-phosphosulfolactate phosphatase
LLRPAVEDFVGAGAILDALSPTRPSPEAMAAIAAHRALTDMGRFLRECASGKELAEQGFAVEVALAAQVDVSSHALRLVKGAFGPERGGAPLVPRPRPV